MIRMNEKEYKWFKEKVAHLKTLMSRRRVLLGYSNDTAVYDQIHELLSHLNTSSARDLEIDIQLFNTINQHYKKYEKWS